VLKLNSGKIDRSKCDLKNRDNWIHFAHLYTSTLKSRLKLLASTRKLMRNVIKYANMHINVYITLALISVHWLRGSRAHLLQIGCVDVPIYPRHFTSLPIQSCFTGVADMTSRRRLPAVFCLSSSRSTAATARSSLELQSASGRSLPVAAAPTCRTMLHRPILFVYCVMQWQ